jgi:hypothetical protein
VMRRLRRAGASYPGTARRSCPASPRSAASLPAQHNHTKVGASREHGPGAQCTAGRRLCITCCL